MKNYKKLANTYVKKNSFANNTLAYYRKPIFITLISCLVICICSLLIIQVSNIEKSERKKTIVYVTRTDSVELLQKEYQEDYPNFNVIILNSKVASEDIEAINILNSHNIERMNISQGYILYKNTVVLYYENGNLKNKYTQYTVYSALKEAGWI